MLNSLRSKLDRKLHQYDHATSTIREEKQRLRAARQELNAVLHAQDILQQTAQLIQTKAHQQIAGVVSRCLSAVFSEPYELRIEFERRRGRTEAEFVYYRDGNRLDPRLTSDGVLEVASLALRLACLILTQPQPRRFLALDEPFRGLSVTNRAKMATLVETLAEELDVQFLIVTHDESLMIGKVIQL